MGEIVNSDHEGSTQIALEGTWSYSENPKNSRTYRYEIDGDTDVEKRRFVDFKEQNAGHHGVLIRLEALSLPIEGTLIDPIAKVEQYVPIKLNEEEREDLVRQFGTLINKVVALKKGHHFWRELEAQKLQSTNTPDEEITS